MNHTFEFGTESEVNEPLDYVPNVATEWGDEMEKLVEETRTGIYDTVYGQVTVANENLRNLLFNTVFGNWTGLMLMNKGENALSAILQDFYRHNLQQIVCGQFSDDEKASAFTILD